MAAHLALADINSAPHWPAEKQFLAPRPPRPQLPVQTDPQCNMEKGLQRNWNNIDSEVSSLAWERGDIKEAFSLGERLFLKEDELGTPEQIH